MVGRGATVSAIRRCATASAIGRGAAASAIGTASSVDTEGQQEDLAVSAAITAGWEPLSHYNPMTGHGASVEGTLHGYWQRYIKSDGDSVTCRCSLSKPALGGETISWYVDEDDSAVEDVHWSTTSPKDFTFSRGDLDFEIEITPIESGKWYLERTMRVRLFNGVGLSIDGERGFIHIIFGSSAPPPILLLTGPSSLSGESTFDVTVSSEYADGSVYKVKDAVEVWPEVSDDSVIPASKVDLGTLPWTLSADSSAVTKTITLTGTVTGDLKIELVHERADVAFVQHDYDPKTQTFTVPRDVHTDENLWRYCHDMNLLAYDEPLTDQERPITPGHPTNHLSGGAAKVHRELFGEQESLPQDAQNPILDPLTGNALRLFHPSDNIVQGMTYIREGFEAAYGGAPITAHEIQPWVMVRWYFAEMTDQADADRNAEFAQVRVRIRNSNRNHGIAFRFSHNLGPGDDGWKEHADGSSVGQHYTTFASGLVVWEYSKFNGHPGSDEGWGTYYGADEDENGTYLWFVHHCDGDVDYDDHIGESTATDAGWWYITRGKMVDGEYREYNTKQVELDDSKQQAIGNPIQYPVWSHDEDGSRLAGENTLGQIRLHRKGRLMYGFQFWMSPNQLGPPGRYWPSVKSQWNPRGNAVIANTGDSHKHTITVT